MSTTLNSRIRSGLRRALALGATLTLTILVVGPAAAQAPGDMSGAGEPAPAAVEEEESLKPSTICLGPFTPHEMELYGSLAEAHERLTAAEAALTLREHLLESREVRIAMQLEEMVRIEQRLDAKLMTYREEQARRDAEKKAARLRPPSPEELAVRQQRAAQLSKMIKSMKADAAAKMIAELPAGLATQLLSSLPARRAGKILSTMDPEAASALSVSFIHTRDPRGQGGF